MGVVVLLINIPTSVWGQKILFNKTYPNDSCNSSVFVGVAPIWNGYITTGTLTQNANRAAFTAKLDLKGNILWSKLLIPFAEQSINMVCPTTLCSTLDSNYVMAVNVGVDVDHFDCVLIKFDPKGEIIWQRNYDRPASNEYNIQTTVDPDGGYTVACSSYLPNAGTGSSVYLIKTDSLGDTLWTRHYYDPAGENLTLYYALKTKEGGYLLSGYQGYYATNYFVIKTDSAGGTIWQRYHHSSIDGNSVAAIELPNGNIFAIGSVDWRERVYTALLNGATGELIISREYDMDGLGPCGAISLAHITNNGTVKQLVYNYTTYADVNDLVGALDLRLMEFSETGAIIHQSMSYLSGVPNDDDYIRSLQATPDGGFIMSGFNLSSQPRPWLLKTDAEGTTCSGYECLYEEALGITSDVLSAGFAVSPNPFTDHFVIENNTHLAATLLLYDSMGREIANYPLSNARNTIGTATWTAAVYHYRIIDRNSPTLLQQGSLVRR